MNKEEIKHFKSLLRQGYLRHMNILLDDKFQKELLTIIKDYEKLQQENQELKRNCNIGYENFNFYREENQKYKEVINKAIEYINKMFETGFYNDDYYLGHLKMILKDKEVE